MENFAGLVTKKMGRFMEKVGQCSTYVCDPPCTRSTPSPWLSGLLGDLADTLSGLSEGATLAPVVRSDRASVVPPEKEERISS